MARRTEEGKRRRRESTAKWNRANPEKRKQYARRRYLRDRYGITPEQYDEMLLEQNSSCAICKTVTSLCVDHNHDTGEVRGLLCTQCNLALGLLGDTHTSLQRAVNYLVP